ncbi:hypothetical protein CDL15_Pgr015948 [Punica granatum]|uniref:Uncharacterized protein n=1 Tax=Punica granatum TaxID=22663 RepID=A0A218XRN0_PUNGR|nr:hypothetical protein CDL15_Pgr015948 [Punica granatum]PKI38421.1 hypothetical protein CRG98_041201 [Punica granatum]
MHVVIANQPDGEPHVELHLALLISDHVAAPVVVGLDRLAFGLDDAVEALEAVVEGTSGQSPSSAEEGLGLSEEEENLSREKLSSNLEKMWRMSSVMECRGQGLWQCGVLIKKYYF